MNQAYPFSAQAYQNWVRYVHLKVAFAKAKIVFGRGGQAYSGLSIFSSGLWKNGITFVGLWKNYKDR